MRDERKLFPSVTLQALHDVGLNPFAVELLAESSGQHPNPKPITFSHRKVKEGQELTVFIAMSPKPFDPTFPNEG